MFLSGQDPNKFCLYCVGSDGSLNTIGVYDTASEWKAGLEAQQEACGCGQGNPGSGGECGALKTETTKLREERALCCIGVPYSPCFAKQVLYDVNCYVECGNPPCEHGACSLQPIQGSAGLICHDEQYWKWDCHICCAAIMGGTCSTPTCPECPQGWSQPSYGVCQKTQYSATDIIHHECKCG